MNVSVFMGSYSAIKCIYLQLNSILDFKQIVRTSLPKCVASKTQSHCFQVLKVAFSSQCVLTLCDAQWEECHRSLHRGRPRLLREVFSPWQSICLWFFSSHVFWAPRDDTQMYPHFPTLSLQSSLVAENSDGHRHRMLVVSLLHQSSLYLRLGYWRRNSGL